MANAPEDAVKDIAEHMRSAADSLEKIQKSTQAQFPLTARPETDAMKATRKTIKAVRSALLHVRGPAKGYVTGKWDGKQLTELNWLGKDLTKMSLVVVTQPDGQPTPGTVVGAVFILNSKAKNVQLVPSTVISRIQIHETKDGPVVAVGGPIPLSE